MERWQGKVAVVTGCSAGIGAAISEKLSKAGVVVAGLARTKNRLDELADKLKNEPGKFHPIQTDVIKEKDILDAFEWIEKNLGPINVLVNNAGIMTNTNLVEGCTEMWREIVDLNVLGLCVCTREAVKSMRKNNVDGHIVHINSVAGHKVIYFSQSNVYPGSKHAVTALTETLRQELNSIGSKIKISSVSPGYVDTAFRTESGFTSLYDAASLKPVDVADAVLYVLETPPHVQVHELIVKPVGETF